MDMCIIKEILTKRTPNVKTEHEREQHLSEEQGIGQI